jgi:outer membrane protein OmpA-like peptidoglycan-associated protein
MTMNRIEAIHAVRTSLPGIIAISLALALAACGNVSRNVARDGTSAGELVWPAPDATTPMHRDGTFPDRARLRNVKAGLNKQQLADLIGYPHFSEGFWGVREWNYLFNFRTPGSDEVTVCQYKVLFDGKQIARSFYWKPASCADLVREPVAPTAVAKAAPAAPRVLSADALFAFDKAELSLAGRQALHDLTAELKEQGDALRAVYITGYTDRLGDDARNQALSQQRADAVKRYLVAQGVPADRILTVGFGEADPVKDCTADSRAQLIACLAPNRRVEVRIHRGG